MSPTPTPSSPAERGTATAASATGSSDGGGWLAHTRRLLWVPSLYLAMGIPFNVVNGTAVRMYKSLGYTDSQITVPLGFMGIAWSAKPLWAAFLDMYRTKRFFVLTMELLLAVLIGAIAFVLPTPFFVKISIAIFWVISFASSTQDICGDGIYLTALDKARQAKLAGVQGMFWILGKVLATGVIVWVLDEMRASRGWSNQYMWQAVFVAIAAVMGLLTVYHFFRLPAGSIEHRPHSAAEVVRDFLGTAETFFHKRAFWGMIAFVFLYRLGEGLILMEGQLFLQSSTAQGGLGLSAGQVSAIDAVYGTVASIIGGLLGGMLVSRVGLSVCLGFLGLSLNIPHVTYVVLSQVAAGGHGASYGIVVTMVSIEKFGYGFGFVGNMIYMMQQLAPGRATMTHYAFATALMNLMLIPTSMVSGPLAEWLGFSTFFLVVMAASIPSAWSAFKAPFPRKADHPAGARLTDAEAHLTADDPTRLSEGEQRVQKIAGKASIYAMLNILMLLLVDAKILGSLQGEARGSGKLQFGLLLGSAVIKGFCTLRAFKFSGEASAAGAAIGDKAYVGNARGARITSWLCAAATAAVLAFGARMAF